MSLKKLSLREGTEVLIGGLSIAAGLLFVSLTGQHVYFDTPLDAIAGIVAFLAGVLLIVRAAEKPRS